MSEIISQIFPEKWHVTEIQYISFHISWIFGNKSNYIIFHMPLTHWGRVTHICVSKPTNIGSDNGLSPGRRQAIIWTNAVILLIGPLVTNFNETSIEIHIFSFKKIYLKLSSGKWRPFCLGLNVLICQELKTHGCVFSTLATGAVGLNHQGISAHRDSADSIFILLD